MLGWLKKCAAAVILSLLIMHCTVATVQAVEDIQTLNQEIDKVQQPVAQAPNLAWETVKMLFVLGLIVVVAWSIIRVFNRSIKRRYQGNWLHVVDEVMLGQNRGVILCEVGQRLYALGVTDHSITYLFEIDNPQILKEISQTGFDTNQNPNENPLQKIIFDIVGNKRNTGDKKAEFHQLMEEQVNRMKNISLPGSGKTGEKGRSNADKERS